MCVDTRFAFSAERNTRYASHTQERCSTTSRHTTATQQQNSTQWMTGWASTRKPGRSFSLCPADAILNVQCQQHNFFFFLPDGLDAAGDNATGVPRKAEAIPAVLINIARRRHARGGLMVVAVCVLARAGWVAGGVDERIVGYCLKHGAPGVHLARCSPPLHYCCFGKTHGTQSRGECSVCLCPAGENCTAGGYFLVLYANRPLGGTRVPQAEILRADESNNQN